MKWVKVYSAPQASRRWKSSRSIQPSDIENQRPIDVWKGSEFPIFGNTTMKKYRHFNRLVINPLFYVPILLSYPFVIICLGNIVVRGSNEPLYVTIIALLGISYMISFHIIMIPHILSFFPSKKIWKERIEAMFDALPFLVEDLVIVVGIFVLCIILIRRNLAGPCPQGASIFDLQACNPYASTHGIASDLLFFTFVAPITVQVVLKNVSIFALCITWTMIVASTIFCLVFTQAWTDTFTLCLLPIVITISFEVERLYRISYMQLVSFQEQEKRTKKRTELQLLAEQKLMEESNEKKLQATETYQLRCLMGNVAHDLKTPLVSFCGDVDLLKMFYNALSQNAIREACAKLSVNGEFAIKPKEIFRSLWSTSHFMLAAINRGQDYMKATNGVKLIPSNETFELANTIEMVVRCTKQLFPEGRRLIIHPLPFNVCSHIISDSHWLMENLLCLISNAVKYSEAGNCDVRFEFVDTADRLNSPRSAAFEEGSVVATESPPAVLLKAESFTDRDSRDITHHIKITVEDHGIGIALEKRKDLFGIFRQAQRSAGGTGLGLFSLHERVKALGGSCGVISRPDGEQGSTFWLCFPYRPDADAAKLLRLQQSMSSSTRRQLSIESVESMGPPVTPTPPPVIPNSSYLPTSSNTLINAIPSVATEGSLPPLLSLKPPTLPTYDSSPLLAIPAKNRTILVTDDATPILKVVTRLLVNHGYMVDTANNGSKCLEKLKKGYAEGKYDMLLTDVQMPIMDGIECTQRFRAWETEECNKKQLIKNEESAERQGLTDGLVSTRSRFLIVGFSANSDTDTKKEGLTAGMDYFVDKPFNFIEFEKLVSSHWEKGKTRIN